MTNYRDLTPGEIALGRSIFGSSINYSSIQIYRNSYNPLQPSDTTMTPNGNMYFTPDSPNYRTDFSTATPDLKAHFIHELTHAWQHQQGSNVALSALALAILSGDFRGYGPKYDYGNPVQNPRNWSNYTIEQQANIIEDYYRLSNGLKADKPWVTIEMLRKLIPQHILNSLPENAPIPENRPQCFSFDTIISTESNCSGVFIEQLFWKGRSCSKENCWNISWHHA
jgi:hypothetical protein